MNRMINHDWPTYLGFRGNHLVSDKLILPGLEGFCHLGLVARAAYLSSCWKMTMGRPWGLLSWKKYREWAWGPRSNWWMPARNWSSPNSCSVGQDSSNTGDKTQVLKVSYLKSTLSRLYLLHKTPHHSHQLSCFLNKPDLLTQQTPRRLQQSMRFARPWRLGLALVAAEPCQAACPWIFPSKWPSISAILHILLL